jgi:predicted ATPase/DNA-binding CsgD family transcriptional regulator
MSEMNDEVHRAIGRGEQLALLGRLLDDIGAARTRFLVLRGEPGIGKTTLLVHLARLANERGFTVLERCATELERDTPFSVLVDALDGHLAALDDRRLAGLTTDSRYELAAVFPSLRSLAPAAAAGDTETSRTHQAVRELLEWLAAERPVLVALDDLHWADAATLELIGHLLRRPPRGRVLVATALGPGKAPAGVEAAIEAAVRNGAAREMEIGPLTADQAGEILDEAEPVQRERLYRESGGNPFYLEQLVRDTARRDRAGVPPGVAAAIQGELDALPASARALAEAAAVAGDPFGVDLAAEIAGLVAAEALSAVDELVVRGIAHPTELARRFRFRHPLVHTAIYEGFAPGSRLAAHGRAAAALAARRAPAVERARHLEASAAAGDRDAVTTLLEAAKADPAGAERWRAAAQRLLPARPREMVGGGRLAALSDREREVARLVRHRRTNAQIADELFVSLKTVETHLRNIFAKLGVSSRVEVAELVERDEHP